MDKLLSFVKSRKKIKKEVAYFRKHIKKGLYLFLTSEQSFKKVSVLTIFNVKNIKRLYFFSGKGSISYFAIKKGTEKLNLITDSQVISRYYINGVDLKKIKKNIDCFLPKLGIKHNSYESFSVEDNIIICPKIVGKTINDERHDELLLQTILKSVDNSEVSAIDGTYFYAQHGDAYGGNVIWVTDEDFITIDNEGVGLYPAFYDAFMLISINVKSAKDFMDVCNKNIRYFNDFGKHNNIKIDKDFFDYYISLFVIFRMNSYFGDKTAVKHRPFLFLDKEESFNYFPNAKRVLDNIYNGRSNERLDELYKKAGI